MTEQNETREDTTESGDSRQRWVNEVQEALDRTGDAIRTAWDATRESRMSALESAKQAAQELGDAIDKGITAAKERWAAAEERVDEPAPRPEPAAAKPTQSSTAGDVTVTPVDTEESDQT